MKSINELLETKKKLLKQINSFPYDGYPEIKSAADKKRYIYIRKTVAGKKKSTYVAPYEEVLFNSLRSDYEAMRKLQHELNKVTYELAKLGYADKGDNPKIIRNIGFIKSNIKNIIYDQTIVEGIGCTFAQTEAILENRPVDNMTPKDIQKILNLKRAWEFVLDNDVAHSPTDYYLLTNISQKVNENDIPDAGKLRTTPVKIGGSSYKPPIPIESLVKEQLNDLFHSKKPKIDIAIDILCYCTKSQLFTDGNKRTAVITCNHYLLNNGLGYLSIGFNDDAKFKKHLIAYYENKNDDIKGFLKKHCFHSIDEK